MLVYKYTETIKEKLAYILWKLQTSQVQTREYKQIQMRIEIQYREFLGWRMRNFQGIAIWSRAYSEIFKSALGIYDFFLFLLTVKWSLYKWASSCLKTKANSHFAVKFVERSYRLFSVYLINHLVWKSVLFNELWNFNPFMTETVII